MDMGNYRVQDFSFSLFVGFKVMYTCTNLHKNSFPGSTPLHLAARAGSLDCIRELLAWGAERLQRDDLGYCFFPSF